MDVVDPQRCVAGKTERWKGEIIVRVFADHQLSMLVDVNVIGADDSLSAVEKNRQGCLTCWIRRIELEVVETTKRVHRVRTSRRNEIKAACSFRIWSTILDANEPEGTYRFGLNVELPVGSQVIHRLPVSANGLSFRFHRLLGVE